jgi:CubicO group peptidase (beta-lactamase class C family)
VRWSVRHKRASVRLGYLLALNVASPGIGRPLGQLKPTRSTLILVGALGCGLLISLLVFFVSTAPYFISNVNKGAPEAAFKRELDRTAPGLLHELRVPGVVVATVIHGSPSHVYAYGFADVAQRKPMTPASVFRVASLSKSLTAWGVLRLAEQGKIDLERPVQTYLPAWPLPPSQYPSSAVTVRQLLSHTSGLTEGADTLRRPDEPAKSTAEALMVNQANGFRAALVRPAGKAYIYSAPGYMILQMMIETQSHESFGDYMRDNVLRPLGMNRSSFDWQESLREQTATPYGSDRRPTAMMIPDDTAADGLFSTGEDMARFMAAPLPGGAPIGAGVLTPDSVDELYGDPVNMPRVDVAGVAKELPLLGSFVQKTPGQPDIITNGGYDPGWSSRFYMVPSTGDGLVVLTNSSQGRPMIGHIGSLWSAWRGLPILTMTSAYRSITLAANTMIGLLTTLGVFLGGHFLAEWADGRRRRIHLVWRGMIKSLFELLLAFAVIGVWVGEHEEIRVLPTVNGIGSAVILFYTVVVFARLLMPPEWTPALRASSAPAVARRLANTSAVAGAQQY